VAISNAEQPTEVVAEAQGAASHATAAHAATAARPPIDRLDPRSRLLAAAAFSGLVAVINRLDVLLAACGLMFFAALVNRSPLPDLVRRLRPLNAFMALLLVLLPLTTPGPAVAALGPLRFSGDGLHLAAVVAAKGNAIVLGLVVLLGSLDVTVLGHALWHLRVPEKLAHLLLFTVRYIEVLRREYQRLRQAMQVRGFRPGMNRHTYRSFGYLVGMLLVRSLERSERIVAAMQCRGFRGRFYLLDHFSWTRADAAFGLLWAAMLAGLAWSTWGLP